MPPTAGTRIIDKVAEIECGAKLNDTERERVLILFSKFPEAFCRPPCEWILSKLDPVVIDVGDAKPTRVPARRIPHSQLKYLKQEIEFLLKIGIIEPSTSPWSGPNVFAGQLSRSECFWAPVFFFSVGK